MNPLKWQGALIGWFCRLYSVFWRIEHVRHPPIVGPRVYAHPHGDAFLLVAAYQNSRMSILCSPSRDGERLAWLLKTLRFRVVRGSSSRGGASGLKGLIDAVRKDGWNGSLAVDGPRGPALGVKPGIMKLGQATECAIVPVGCAVSSKIVFKKSWDRCYLPNPFARCVILYGRPFHVAANATESEMEQQRLQLEMEIRKLRIEAEELVRPRGWIEQVPKTIGGV